MTTKRVRWCCPTGEHAAVLGPTKPRANATCRFCLECSAKSNVLVERVPPALRKKQEEARTKIANRRREKAAKDRAHRARPFIIDGGDMRAEYRRLSASKRARIELTLIHSSAQIEDIVLECINDRKRRNQWGRRFSPVWGTKAKDRATTVCRIAHVIFGEHGPSVIDGINEVYKTRMPISTSHHAAISWLKTVFLYEDDFRRFAEAGMTDAVNAIEYGRDPKLREALTVIADAYLEGKQNEASAMLSELVGDTAQP